VVVCIGDIWILDLVGCPKIEKWLIINGIGVTLNHVKVASTGDIVGASDAFSDADFYEECSRFEDVILKFST